MKPKGKSVLAFYWRTIRRYPRKVTGLAIFLPITIFVNSFLPPLILANVLSRLSQHRYIGHGIWANFGPQLVLYALIELVGGVVTWRIVDYFVWTLEGNVQRDLAQTVFNAMIDQSADFHANNFSGSLVSQNTKLLSAYVRIADTTWFQVSQVVFGLLFTIIILAPRAPLFVVALALSAMLYLAIAFWASRPVRRQGGRLSASESKQTGYLADAITNVMAIKSFARGAYEKRRYGTTTDTTYGHLVKLMRAQRRQLNTFDIVITIMTTLALLFAIVSVVIFGANIATVFLIFNYTSYVINQLFQFSNSSLRAFNRAFGDASEMIAVLNKVPEIQDPAQPEQCRIRYGNIEFQNITFQHAGAADVLFKDFSLKIKHGEKVGLVGHSGSGKTTFTRLLLHFSDVDSGTILIDGQTSRTLPRTTCTRGSLTCRRNHCYSTVLSMKISATAIRRPMNKLSAAPPNWPMPPSSLMFCPKATKPWLANVVSNFPAASASGLPLPALCSRMRQY